MGTITVIFLKIRELANPRVTTGEITKATQITPETVKCKPRFVANIWAKPLNPQATIRKKIVLTASSLVSGTN
jgi:hypothetical protein